MVESLRSFIFGIDRSTQKLTTGIVPYFDPPAADQSTFVIWRAKASTVFFTKM